MIVQRKHVFTCALVPSNGETPDLLMTAIALAIHDCAPSLADGISGTFTAAQAGQCVVRGGREILMSIVAGRLCMAEVFATRISSTSVELQFTMYDGDCDALMRRADTRMKQLVAAEAPLEIEVVVDETPSTTFVNIHEMLGEERPEDLLEFLENSVHESTPPHQLRAIA